MHNQHSSFPSTWNGRQKEALVFFPAHKANTEKTRGTFKLRVTAVTGDQNSKGVCSRRLSRAPIMAAAFQTTDVYRVPPEDTPPTQHSGCTEAMKGFPGGGMTLVASQLWNKYHCPSLSPDLTSHFIQRSLLLCQLLGQIQEIFLRRSGRGTQGFKD